MTASTDPSPHQNSPTPAPRSFRRLPAHTDQRRSWSIVVGLVPGYGDRPPQPLDVVHQTHRRWMLDRIRRGHSYLTAIITPATLSYAWPRPDATAGATAGEAVTEPAAELRGEVSVLYQAHIDDTTARRILEQLATVLGDQLNQQRIYVSFRDRSWVMERL